jgi:hypothetical protein
MDGVSKESLAPPITTAPSVTQNRSEQIAGVQQLTLAELRAEWRRLFRTQPPSLSRDLIIRAIAYRLQELTHGGLPKATSRKLAGLANELKADGRISADTGPQIKPGARLVREWRGRTHMITVTDGGFDYAGRNYPSLTKVAHAITGARWSGPRFFGLRTPATRRLAAISAVADRSCASVEASHA